MPLKSTKGMTLIEAMFALLIIVVGLLALVSAIFSSMIQQDSTRMETLAMNWARSKLNELEQNQSLTTTFAQVFLTYTGRTNTDASGNGPPGYPKVGMNPALAYAMKSSKPWNDPGMTGVCPPLNGYDYNTGLPTAPNAVYIPDPIQTSQANGTVKTLFIGWYYIYFPVDNNGNLSVTDDGTNTNAYYNNPNPAINVALMGLGSSVTGNNTDIYGNGGSQLTGAAQNNGRIDSTHTGYVLLPFTIRVVWQDPHTGDERNDYVRYVELHGCLADVRSNE